MSALSSPTALSPGMSIPMNQELSPIVGAITFAQDGMGMPSCPQIRLAV